ncbi:MAG: acetyl-CoA carboxylase, carboxyltransferase subunit beta [Kiritimatiellia bacterium]|jgi:acetyl-CoA carboxylase carboxyl transferase subunit beta|nr:acetyl-CoA carboxylase, carboxyltransferase subunit beta [Kiritimatiellia bacterium]
MSWYERPVETPFRVPSEEVWVVCPACKAYVGKAAWRAAEKVCPRCNHHARLSCRERVALLTDAGSFAEISAGVSFNDPLRFTDASGAYADKARATIAKTGEGESILTGTAAIESIPVVLGIMDFRFLGGSLGSGTGERIRLAAEHAVATRRPLILVSASGGARMHEGIVSLMQMAKTCAAIARVKEAGLPYLSVLTDPTTGGVSASYAMVGDLNLAEPKALIGFAGRRVIEQTIKQKLPDDFQTAEYTLAHGFVDCIVPRKELKAFLANALRYAGF